MMPAANLVVTIFQACAYSCAVVLIASSALVQLTTLISLFWRPVWLVHAVIMSSDAHLRRILGRWRFVLLAALLLGLFAAKMTGRWNLSLAPPSGSKALYWANIIAAMLFYFWLNTGFVHVSGLERIGGGFQRDSPLRRVNAFVAVHRFLGVLVVTTIAAKIPGPFDVWAIVAAVVMSAYNYISFARSVAVLRRGYAPWAQDRSVPYSGGSIALLHLSDVHVTHPSRGQLAGGMGGNHALRNVVDKLARGHRPKYLVVTGDLVDRGDETEWRIGCELLQRVRKLGTRVLLAPGNHDLATAYDPVLAWRHLLQSTSQGRIVDPERLFLYFEAASELEPELITCEGKPLSDHARDERNVIREVETLWQTARTAALEELRSRGISEFELGAYKRGHRELYALERLHSPAADRILDPLLRMAREILLPPDAAADAEVVMQLRVALVRSSGLSPGPEYLRGQRLWTETFPLRLATQDAEVEFLIVNSVLPEPGLLGSAYGWMGKKQLERLRTAVCATTAKNVVVLMHHPFYRWEDEPTDRTHSLRVPIQRWATLGHHTAESANLVKLLAIPPSEECRRVLVCGGHRHGVARGGPWVPDDKPNGASESRLWLLESNSLPNLSKLRSVPSRANDVLVCVRDSSGEWTPQRVNIVEL
jgi:hypothetical protein